MLGLSPTRPPPFRKDAARGVAPRSAVHPAERRDPDCPRPARPSGGGDEHGRRGRHAPQEERGAGGWPGKHCQPRGHRRRRRASRDRTSSHPPPALHSFAHGGSGSRLAWPNASVAPIGVDTQRLDASAWALSAPARRGGLGRCPSLAVSEFEAFPRLSLLPPAVPSDAARAPRGCARRASGAARDARARVPRTPRGAVRAGARSPPWPAPHIASKRAYRQSDRCPGGSGTGLPGERPTRLTKRSAPCTAWLHDVGPGSA